MAIFTYQQREPNKNQTKTKGNNTKERPPKITKTTLKEQRKKKQNKTKQNKNKNKKNRKIISNKAEQKQTRKFVLINKPKQSTFS